MIDYILPSIILIFVGYFIIREIRDAINPNNPKKIYKKYRSLLKDKLPPLGFKTREGSGLGSFSTFTRENLRVELVFELRDSETYIKLNSGKKEKHERPKDKPTLELRDDGKTYLIYSGNREKAKALLDQLPKGIDKKEVIFEESNEVLVNKNDFSLTLVGTDEEKNSFLKTLDGWLAENQ